jgi:hypothetical protein
VRRTSLRSRSVVPHRRYPSLCDDGQPYFPRLQRKIQAMEQSVTGSAFRKSDLPYFLSVRIVALLAIIAIVIGLMGAA